MLVNFQVKNFKSLYPAVNFSMVASAVKRHPSHVAEIEGHGILRSSFLFGANAAGKSNFVKAIDFAKQVIVSGLSETSCDGCQFRLDPKDADETGVFQFTIHSGKRFYEYGFAVSYFTASIVSEWLSVVDGSKDSKLVFSCDWTRPGSIPATEFELAGDEKKRFEVYRDDAAHATSRKVTFLSEIAGKGNLRRNDRFFMHFVDVYRWFRHLIVIFPQSYYGGMAQYVFDSKARTELGTLLNRFDTGIENLDSQEVEAEKAFSQLPPDKREKLKAELIDNLTKDQNHMVSLTLLGSWYLVRFDKGVLRFQKVAANHGVKTDLFDLEDESDGTKRLYDLLPLHGIFSKGAIVVIDELDRSLHTRAVHEFIADFFRQADGRSSQLIATTHDASVLDLDLLRQDEIWFVERDEKHASHLFPLTKFKARFDKDIRKDYLLGRYGALPIFKTIAEGKVE